MKHIFLAALFLVGGCMGGAARREPAAASSGSSGGGSYQAHADRPGLGTAWGEDLYSPVSHVSFERCDAAPTVTAIAYDDPAGVEARLARGASPARPVPYAWLGPEVRVWLVGERGEPMPLLLAGNEWLVAGLPDQRYEIHVVNDGARRWEVVASVDGLDVIDGEAASLARRGYVLDPHDTLRIAGFRRSDHEVAAFRLGSVAGSYAVRTGHGADVGVIGLALFCESGRADEVERRAGATPFPADR